MGTKKILLIHHSGLLGGAGVSLYNTWKALDNKYEVICYIPNDPPDLLNFLRERGLNPRTFKFRLGKLTYYSGGNTLLKPRFWYHALHSLTQIRYWRLILREERPDCVIVNSKVLCWMGKLFNKTKSLCLVRETIPGNPKKVMNRIMRNMLEDFTAVAFLSNYDLLQTQINKATTVVSPDFLNVDDYKKKYAREIACKNLNINPRTFNILFVGGTDRLKGIDLALKAINILKYGEVNLIVAGKNFGERKTSENAIKEMINKIKNRKTIEFSEQIKSYIKQNGIEDKVNFIGIQKDMSDSFSSCDILIFPMKEPHQARPAFEIGVQKKPVIISDFPNIREFVQHGVNGLTFEPNNPEALAQAILKIKNDKELRARLGNCNYEYTMKYHTEEHAMGRLINIIDEII
jgi:glycosyltransferase involved in cell wall biosynthesis